MNETETRTNEKKLYDFFAIIKSKKTHFARERKTEQEAREYAEKYQLQFEEVELKNWDVTYVSYRSEIVKAKTEEEACTIAKRASESGERISTIEETDEEADE